MGGVAVIGQSQRGVRDAARAQGPAVSRIVPQKGGTNRKNQAKHRLFVVARFAVCQPRLCPLSSLRWQCPMGQLIAAGFQSPIGANKL
jgi:hypothetical protein